MFLFLCSNKNLIRQIFLNFKPQNAAVTRLICRSQRFFADRAGQARAPAADAIRGGRIKF